MGIEVIQGDITALEVDAIVNAANESLAHGGGVAAAIARAGAPVVDEESAAWLAEHGPIGPGEAAYTGAGPMPARWVIHVVGPRYREGQDNERLLRQAVEAALERAAELEARSVAMPAISAGIFGYPRAEATQVIAAAVNSWMAAHPDVLDRVVLVGYDEASAADFSAAVDMLG
ncbi:MAG TPA: macro domain-containing protein [Acidimicrobiia bacterium]|nr:macro domain-containing protein [Acidimicrobiia bacterium]